MVIPKIFRNPIRLARLCLLVRMVLSEIDFGDFQKSNDVPACMLIGICVCH